VDQFIVEARSRLGPLLEEFGYSHVGTGPSLVIYDSPHLKARIFQGLRSGTIGIEFIRDGRFINLDDLLAASKIENPGMTSRNTSLTAARLEWLASFLRAQFIGLMTGTPEDFDAVYRVATLRNAAYNKKMVVDPDIARAHEAFRHGRYREVVDLLGPLEAGLTANESQKLAYALKHCGDAR
jgi:hypothetical protein